MARVSAQDPYQSFQYEVMDVDSNRIVGGFVTAAIPEISIEALKYQGAFMRFAHKMPGNVDFTDFTLSRGIFRSDTDVWKWIKSIIFERNVSSNFRTNLAIIHLHRTGSKRVYHMSNCFPINCKLTGDLDANAGDISMEELTLTCESVQMEEIFDTNAIIKPAGIDRTQNGRNVR